MLKNKRLMQIGMIAVSVLLIGGAVLISWLMTTEEKRNVMQVNLETGESKTIQFESLRLIPGESCEYTITLSGERAKEYDVTLDFSETAGTAGTAENNPTLKDFARVTVLANGEIVCDELLAEAFEKEDITLRANFEQEKQMELTVRFYMPLEVGNEAKNAEALFELLITSSNE